MHIDGDNTVVTGISGIKIDMLAEAKVSIFTDNDLTHINSDYFEINLVACLLNQIFVVPVPPPWYDYDDPHANVINEVTPTTSIGATASAPPFSFTVWCIIHLWFNNTIKYGFMIYYLYMFLYIIGINM